ncbi:MAG: hypothetical protein ACXAC7_06765 [Candidatus Hodarchaeales archaeon]|jgi:hypothetical protein
MTSKKTKLKSEKPFNNGSEKKIATTIASKIMDYRNKLKVHPPELISISQSEKDRQEVNEFFPQIKHSMPSQLLDSKFYNQLLIMQRERDKSFLREGTSRKERIHLLGLFIQRLTTPILFLSHKRHIILSDIWEGDKKQRQSEKLYSKKSTKTKKTNNKEIIPEINDVILQHLKKQLLQKLQRQQWTINELNSQLNHWEADILSQMTRDYEISLEIEDRDTINIFISDKLTELKKKGQIQAILLEPKK